MKNSRKLFIWILLLLCVCFLSPASQSFGIDLPQFKTEISSAIVFKIVDTLLLQYGPSIAFLFSINDYNAFGIQVEHLYNEVQNTPEHNASRAVLINLQWIRRIGKTLWGMEYIITPGREYNKSNETSYITRETLVGLIGIGTFLTFTEKRITLFAEGKFANRDIFKTNAGLITMFELSAVMSILQWASLSCEFRYWSNSGLRQKEANKYLLPEKKRINGSVYPSLQLGGKGFNFCFGPVFCLDDDHSGYEDYFVLYGKLGYTLKERKHRHE